MSESMQPQEIEVRYTVELTHKLKIPQGKAAREVIAEFFKAIYEGGPAQGMTYPHSVQLRFMFDVNGERIFLP